MRRVWSTRRWRKRGSDLGLGIGVEAGKQLVPGAKVDVHVYFHVAQPTATAYRFLLSAWPVDRRRPIAGGGDPDGSAGGAGVLPRGIDAKAPPADPAPDRIYRTPLRATADGAFASDRWKAGDYIRERFSLAIPADWPMDRQADGVAIGLVTANPAGGKVKATGAALPGDPYTAVLGILPWGSSQERRP